MQLDLTGEQAVALSKALDTYAAELDRVLVRTDKHELQHALRLESERLAEVRRLLATLLERPPAAPALYT